MRLVPWVGKHAFEIHLFFAEGTNLLFADDAPSSYAKLVEGVTACQSERSN